MFCFHNVVPAAHAGLGDSSLHMTRDHFARVVEWMQSVYDVVPLAEVVDRAARGRGVRGLAAITFDDAYRGVWEHALPLLAAAELPCTIFVVCAFTEHPSHTWWDILGARGLLTAETREEALSARRGLTEEILPTLSAEREAPDLPDVLLPATWETILPSIGDLVAVGSHTVRHANLSALASAELREELATSRRRILERTDRAPEAVSYPYGLSTRQVADVAAAVGYRVGLTLENRPIRRGDEPLGLPRINVPAGISLEALECWAAGIDPRRSR